MGILSEMLGAVERRVHPPIVEVSTLGEFKTTLTRNPSSSVAIKPLIDIPSADKPSGLCGIILSGQSINGSRITCKKLMTQDEKATEIDKEKTVYHLAYRVIRNLKRSGAEANIVNNRGEVVSIPPRLREGQLLPYILNRP